MRSAAAFGPQVKLDMELRGTILLRNTADDTVYVLQTERLEQVRGGRSSDAWLHHSSSCLFTAGPGHCACVGSTWLHVHTCAACSKLCCLVAKVHPRTRKYCDVRLE